MIQTAKFSVDEYHRIVTAGLLNNRRIELLAGKLIELSPETLYHANRNNTVYKYLLLLFASLADVRSGDPITLCSSEPEPDIVLAQLPETRYDDRHPYPKDIYLLIEFSYSTLEYDLAQKKQAYAEAAIVEYWIIDLKHRQLLVFRDPEEGDYKYQSKISSGTIHAIAFPEIKLEINRLLT